MKNPIKCSIDEMRIGPIAAREVFADMVSLLINLYTWYCENLEPLIPDKTIDSKRVEDYLFEWIR